LEKKILEIRWHGRGGQGAKSAAQIVAEASLGAGKFIQAFPEYGAERAGAPMRAFTRISSNKITIHSAIEHPDVVVVIDPTLLSENILEGMKEDSILLVNAVLPPEEVKNKVGFKGKVCTVKATDIALEVIKEGRPNTPILGALAKIVDEISLEDLKKNFKNMFEKKIGTQRVDANIKAMQKGYEEVRVSG